MELTAVIFFRLFESLCSNDSPAQFELHPPYDDDDDEGRSILSSVASLAGSRTSSQCYLVKDAAADGDDDETVSLRNVVFVIVREFKIYNATVTKTSFKIANSSLSIFSIVMSICLTFES